MGGRGVQVRETTSVMSVGVHAERCDQGFSFHPSIAHPGDSRPSAESCAPFVHLSCAPWARQKAEFWWTITRRTLPNHVAVATERHEHAVDALLAALPPESWRERAEGCQVDRLAIAHQREGLRLQAWPHRSSQPNEPTVSGDLGGPHVPALMSPPAWGHRAYSDTDPTPWDCHALRKSRNAVRVDALEGDRPRLTE